MQDSYFYICLPRQEQQDRTLTFAPFWQLFADIAGSGQGGVTRAEFQVMQ